MKLNIKKKEGITIIKPDRAIRTTTIHSFRSSLEKIKKEGVKRIALDLSKVNYIDSSTISILLNFARHQKEKEGEFYLFNCCDKLLEILDITGIGGFVTICKNFDELKKQATDNSKLNN